MKKKILWVRNGISPVTAMLEKGVLVALGLDDKEFGDGKDFFQEMRLASQPHRLSSHQLRKHVQDYFASWGPEMNEIEKSPFYFMNNRY